MAPGVPQLFFPTGMTGDLKLLRNTWMRITTTLCGAMSLVGCTTSQVTFQMSQTQIVRNPQQQKIIEGVKFESSVITKGLGGQQLIYQVTLQDKAGRPIRSRDGRYQTKAGEVAAARSFFVHFPLQTFSNLQVTIPADQFEVRNNHLPITAKVGIYTIAGNELARNLCPIPEAKLLATP